MPDSGMAGASGGSGAAGGYVTALHYTASMLSNPVSAESLLGKYVVKPCVGRIVAITSRGRGLGADRRRAEYLLEMRSRLFMHHGWL